MIQPNEKTAPIDVSQHLGLAHLACRSFRALVGRGFDYDDLFQAACEGLMYAARTFDPQLGAFSTHAVPLARRYVKRHVARHARTVRVPEYAQDDAAAAGKPPRRPPTAADRPRRVQGAPFDWSAPGASLGGPVMVPTELVPYAGVPSTWAPPPPAHHAPSAERSLDHVTRTPDGDRTLYDTVPSDALDPETLVSERERAGWWRNPHFARALLGLTDREFHVLTGRLTDQTQPFLASELGVTKARVQQIEQAAVRKVRASLEADRSSRA